ncbi:DUF3606 domain-containing protein [Variovorax davisae]|uniref:DUF3606 domain-containing protein n=1 Tax=Variovorax davisae TaxID=3053515 RepID=UPI00336557B4
MHHYRVPADPTVIVLKEPWQLEYWRRKMGVTETDLRLAMRAVGENPVEVRRYLDRPLSEPHRGERWE